MFIIAVPGAKPDSLRRLIIIHYAKTRKITVFGGGNQAVPGFRILGISLPQVGFGNLKVASNSKMISLGFQLRG
jgi:hypothetical protein